MPGLEQSGQSPGLFRFGFLEGFLRLLFQVLPARFLRGSTLRCVWDERQDHQGEKRALHRQTLFYRRFRPRTAPAPAGRWVSHVVITRPTSSRLSAEQFSGKSSALCQNG